MAFLSLVSVKDFHQWLGWLNCNPVASECITVIIAFPADNGYFSNFYSLSLVREFCAFFGPISSIFGPYWTSGNPDLASILPSKPLLHFFGLWPALVPPCQLTRLATFCPLPAVVPFSIPPLMVISWRGILLHSQYWPRVQPRVCKQAEGPVEADQADRCHFSVCVWWQHWTLQVLQGVFQYVYIHDTRKTRDHTCDWLMCIVS
jgi:hypothetical protein